MSFQVIPSPTTTSGIHLGHIRDTIVPRFHIHECGFSPGIEDWNSDAMLCPFWCLWHMMDEGSWVECDGERWDLGADNVVLKPAHIVHSIHSSRLVPQLWVHFSLVPDYTFQTTTPFTIPLNPLLRQQISTLMKLYTAAKEDSEIALYHHAAALLHHCFERHPLPLRVLPEALRIVLEKIENSPASDLSNAALARLANTSISTFSHLFESHMHQPPAAYVREVRFQKASKMLIFTDISIEQIAEILGYPNRHYFSRAFAQRAGCGPATFRKQLGKKLASG